MLDWSVTAPRRQCFTVTRRGQVIRMTPAALHIFGRACSPVVPEVTKRGAMFALAVARPHPA